MLKLYGEYWWSFLLRGILAAIFGLIAIFLPGLTLGAMAILVAAFLFMDGAFSLFTALKAKRLDSRWWLLLLEGVAGVAIGTITVFWPDLTLLVIIYFIGAWALITGSLGSWPQSACGTRLKESGCWPWATYSPSFSAQSSSSTRKSGQSPWCG